jgi:hypothetical protein
MNPGPETDVSKPPVEKTAPNVPVAAHVMCGWPLLPLPVRIVLIILTGLAAIALWLGIVVAIQLARQ